MPLRAEICPTQVVPAIVFNPVSSSQDLMQFRWGLIPAWAKQPAGEAPLINARSETAPTKPAFRAAFKHRRCLIPASGFYEWRAVPGRKKRQPIHIGLRDRPLFAFAGLWETCTGEAGHEIQSCTILTTQANSAMAAFHDRMPVILPMEFYPAWLDSSGNANDLTALLRPFPSEEMVMSTEIAEELLSGKPQGQLRLF